MQDTINVLLKEHKKIIAELNSVEQDITDASVSILPPTIEKLKHLITFTSHDHHKLENDVLLAWMLEQNPTADKSIIDRIRNEHYELEGLQKKILTHIDEMAKNKAKISFKSLTFDIKDFIDLYREHIDREEKFIFQIAKGLIANQKN